MQVSHLTWKALKSRSTSGKPEELWNFVIFHKKNLEKWHGTWKKGQTYGILALLWGQELYSTRRIIEKLGIFVRGWGLCPEGDPRTPQNDRRF